MAVVLNFAEVEVGFCLPLKIAPRGDVDDYV